MISVYGLNVERFGAGKSAGFFNKLRAKLPDVVCLQETNCAAASFPDYARLENFHVNDNYIAVAHGRTGVAILSRLPQTSVNRKLCKLAEHETCRGRFIEVTIGTTKFVSVYALADDSKTDKSQQRRVARIQFLHCLKDYMIATFELPCVMVMDANVALSRQDVENDVQYRGPWASATYRDPITSAMEGGRWIDSFRAVHGRRRRATVWTPRNFRAPELSEMGFGIDFQLVSKPLASSIVDAEVQKPDSWAARYSDHAPTVGRYNLTLG